MKLTKIIFGKLMTLTIFICAGILILLGLHGLYTYFNRVEVLLGNIFSSNTLELGYLFGQVPMPVSIQPIVTRFTMWGIQSWYMPSISVVVGIVLIWKSRNILRWFGIWC